MANLIIEKLKARSTDQLKQDVKTAMDSEDEGAALVFVFGLDVLEERLSEADYSNFENSL